MWNISCLSCDQKNMRTPLMYMDSELVTNSDQISHINENTLILEHENMTGAMMKKM